MRYLAVSLIAALVWPAPLAAQTPFAAYDAASEAVLNDPHDLEIGPDGRLYIADKFGNRIAVMDPETLEIVETIGEGDLLGVHDVDFGPDGRAYAAVTGVGAVAVYSFADGTATLDRVLGGFPRTEGALAHSNGRLYVMAGGAGALVAVADGQVVAAVDGLGGAHDVEEGPDGTIWVADNFRRRLVQFTADLTMLKVLDGPEFGFVGPRYLAVDDFGRLVVADQDAHRVLLIDPVAGTLLGTIGDGTPGLGPYVFDDPEGVAVRGSTYFVSDSDNNRVVRYVVVLN